MKNLGIILIIGLVIFGSGLVVWETYLAPEEPGEPERSEEAPPEERRQPDTELDTARFTLYSEDGRTRWELGADKVQQFEDSSHVELTDVQAEVEEDGEQVLTLTAARGEVDTRSGFLSFAGPIIVESSDRRLEANQLNWNESRNELIGYGDVVLERPGMTVTGESMIAQMDLNRVRVKGEAEAIYNEVGEKSEH